MNLSGFNGKMTNQVIEKAFILMFALILLSNALLAQYSRKVVFEEFSEVWCGPCASVTPMLTKWFENHPDYIPIIYYSYFFDDGKQVFNSKADYDQRNSFYSVPFFPYARINAELAPNTSWPGYPTDTNKINSMIDTMTTTTAVKVVIDFVNNGATGTVNVELTSDVELTNKYFYVFIVEKAHHYQRQSNGLEDFHFIFRDLLPSPDGQLFTINAGQTLNYSFDYSIADYINFDLFATVIVQDAGSKQIYQSESVFKPAPNSVTEAQNIENKLEIVPNPVSENLNIVLNSSNETIRQIDIYNSLGNNINSIEVNFEINKLSLSCFDAAGNGIPDGIYYLRVQTEKQVYSRKFVVIR